MLARIQTATICGLESVKVEVEVDVARQSFPGFSMVGLPDKSIDEAKERVRSAIVNSGATFPQHRITVNLAPADLPKNGPAFDLPIAVGLLLASEQITTEVADCWFMGELSLDGRLRPISGVLALVSLAKRVGARQVFVPIGNQKEAAMVEGIEVYGVSCLKDLVLHLTKVSLLPPSPATVAGNEPPLSSQEVDMANILGQEQAKRALEIAAAGSHNILLEGLPGSGKTLLAKAFPGILPELNAEELLEVNTIYSVCGQLQPSTISTQRPYRSPHHTTSSIGLIGGGTQPKPGEVSLAHKGVLFLDEFPEFPRSVLEVLRQPLEDGVVTVSRARASYTFPAQFQLLAAQNPCPCGHYGDPKRQCQCTLQQITKYQKRISGPLLDRIDLFVTVPRVEEKHFSQIGQAAAESSRAIQRRVQAARQLQQRRLKESGKSSNAEMGIGAIKEFCQLGQEQTRLLTLAVDKYQLSARSYFRVLKVSRTIADLAGSQDIEVQHITEALQYRKSE